jgi:hypothetical protein
MATRTFWQVNYPWRQPWPRSAGFNFELLSAGLFRYAGGGYGVRLCMCSFAIEMKRIPSSHGQPMAMQQQAQGMMQR